MSCSFKGVDDRPLVWSDSGQGISTNPVDKLMAMNAGDFCGELRVARTIVATTSAAGLRMGAAPAG
jgi:hypothetical protein